MSDELSEEEMQETVNEAIDMHLVEPHRKNANPNAPLTGGLRFTDAFFYVLTGAIMSEGFNFHDNASYKKAIAQIALTAVKRYTHIPKGNQLMRFAVLISILLERALAETPLGGMWFGDN